MLCLYIHLQKRRHATDQSSVSAGATFCPVRALLAFSYVMSAGEGVVIWW